MRDIGAGVPVALEISARRSPSDIADRIMCARTRSLDIHGALLAEEGRSRSRGRRARGIRDLGAEHHWITPEYVSSRGEARDRSFVAVVAIGQMPAGSPAQLGSAF